MNLHTELAIIAVPTDVTSEINGTLCRLWTAIHAESGARMHIWTAAACTTDRALHDILQAVFVPAHEVTETITLVPKQPGPES